MLAPTQNRAGQLNTAGVISWHLTTHAAKLTEKRRKFNSSSAIDQFAAVKKVQSPGCGANLISWPSPLSGNLFLPRLGGIFIGIFAAFRFAPELKHERGNIPQTVKMFSSNNVLRRSRGLAHAALWLVGSQPTNPTPYCLTWPVQPTVQELCVCIRTMKYKSVSSSSATEQIPKDHVHLCHQHSHLATAKQKKSTIVTAPP